MAVYSASDLKYNDSSLWMVLSVFSGAEASGVFHAFCRGMDHCHDRQSAGALFRAQAEAGAQAQLYCDRGRSSGSGDRAFISCCIPNASFYLVLYPGSSGLICRD